jgi:CheY-like chemotaxis protein
MVYGFVKQSGGHTELHSVEGEGTRVGIFLPRASDEVTSTGDVSATSAEPRSNGESVLVVEDDADVRTLTVALLEGLGYTVVDAANADEALSLLGSTTRVDLLLTDVVLPGGTMGPELAKKAKREWPEIGILFMSGYARDVLGDHDQSIAGVEVLQKPFRKADLAWKVHFVLHQGPVESDAVVSP